MLVRNNLRQQFLGLLDSFYILKETPIFWLSSPVSLYYYYYYYYYLNGTLKYFLPWNTSWRTPVLAQKKSQGLLLIWGNDAFALLAVCERGLRESGDDILVTGSGLHANKQYIWALYSEAGTQRDSWALRKGPRITAPAWVLFWLHSQPGSSLSPFFF